MRTLLTTAAIAALLAGCGTPDTAPLTQEAGLQRNAFFGDATMNNSLVATGLRDPIAMLAHRFGGEVPHTVYFAFGSAELGPDAHYALDAQAQWMHRFPHVRFTVTGHADAPGSGAANHRLGLARAHAVVRYLETRGIGKGRLHALASKGDLAPAVHAAGREAANRRAVVAVIVPGRSHPPPLDGAYAATIQAEYVASAAAGSTVQGTSVGSGQ